MAARKPKQAQASLLLPPEATEQGPDAIVVRDGRIGNAHTVKTERPPLPEPISEEERVRRYLRGVSDRQLFYPHLAVRE